MRGCVCVSGAPVYRYAHTISTLGNMKITRLSSWIEKCKIFFRALKKLKHPGTSIFLESAKEQLPMWPCPSTTISSPDLIEVPGFPLVSCGVFTEQPARSAAQHSSSSLRSTLEASHLTLKARALFRPLLLRFSVSLSRAPSGSGCFCMPSTLSPQGLPSSPLSRGI